MSEEKQMLKALYRLFHTERAKLYILGNDMICLRMETGNKPVIFMTFPPNENDRKLIRKRLENENK